MSTSPPIPLEFFGRHAERKHLYDLVTNKQRTPKIIAITGPAGVGKTAFGISFLRGISRQFNPIWISAPAIHDDGELIARLISTIRVPKNDTVLILDDIQALGGAYETFTRSVLGLKRIRAVIGTVREIGRPVFDIDRIHLSGLEHPADVELLAFHMDIHGLLPASDEEMTVLAEKARGHPLTLMMIASLLRDHTVNQIIFQLEHGLENLGFQLPRTEEDIVRVVVPKIIVTNEELLRNLKRHPQDLHRISHRKFEELLAELLDDMGCEVKLTPGSKDGGKDIIAVMNTPLGKVLCLVEAKHYSPKRPVQVSLVRQLFGTYMDHGANSAMLVTSSRFTRGARQFQSRHEYQIKLKEYEDVVEWIQKYKSEPVDNSGSKSIITLR